MSARSLFFSSVNFQYFFYFCWILYRVKREVHVFEREKAARQSKLDAWSQTVIRASLHELSRSRGLTACGKVKGTTAIRILCVIVLNHSRYFVSATDNEPDENYNDQNQGWKNLSVE